MDPEQETEMEEWVATLDARYAKAGFPKDRRDKWAEYNRQKYRAHASRPKQPVTPSQPVDHEPGGPAANDRERAKLAEMYSPREPNSPTNPVNPGPRPSYLMGLMSSMGLDEEQAKVLARTLYSGQPAGARTFDVPNGPHGWNHEEPGVPEMIPNANGPATKYPRPYSVPPHMAKGPPRNYLAMPDDPEQRRAWLDILSGGNF